MGIMRVREVLKTVGLGRATIYKMMDDGNFPRPLKLGTRAIGWKSTEIQEWIEGRKRA